MRNLLRVRFLMLFPLLLILSAASYAQVGVGVSITVAPPALPVYEQPPCPTEGYLWTPGFWGYGVRGYFWTPGLWVAPPHPGLLWTPGYWGFGGGAYLWHGGYWGPHVGFYGGINYGFGYGGVGFWGGRWEGGHFLYNSAAWHVGVGFHGVYEDRSFAQGGEINHASFNGEGGARATPTAGERAAMNEQHFGRTQEQISQRNYARVDRSNYASVNHGTPAHPEGMGVNARQDRQQNRESRQIYRDKHNARTDAHPEGGERGGGRK